uniref:ankyrin-3-like n=1 Tax=Myxine glutinosa TaxID=7769 RepID=UPI0035902682
MAHAASHLKKTRDEVLPAKPVVTLTRADTQKALQANGESETTEEGEAKGRRSSGKQRRRKSGGTAGLLRAARAGNVEKVLELLNLGGDVNTRNEAGLTALHLAAKEGHAVIVSELLQRDADVAAATKKGNQALHVACLAGKVEVARVLIRRGADVNAQAQHGFTPLYMASQENHVEVLRLLLENGADQTIPTEDGFTPLAVALQQGHEPAVATLLESDIRRPGSREGQGGESNRPAPPRTRLPALHAAARKGDMQAVGIILDGGHHIESDMMMNKENSSSGFTALHIAAHYGSQDVAVLLLDRGADCNFKANNGITPLHVSAKRGHTELVTTLLDHGATIDAGTRDGLTPLHCAARSGHESTVRLLIERGTPILAQTKNGLSPLHMASQGDHPPTMRTLLAGGSPVDPVTLDLLTPLHVAAHCGHHRAARVLLEGGSDPNAKALNGFTPLHVACKKVRRRVIQLLLRFGASLQATTRSGLTPLHVAAFMGNADVETLLMQNGAQPNATNTRGETPLHVAAREGHVQAAEELMQGGSETDACTQDGDTPLHVAAREDQEKVVDKLIGNGAPLNVKNKNGFTPLHVAAQHGSKGAAKVLLDSKVLNDPQGKHDLTPLHVAVHYGHPDVALLLLERGASPHCITKSGHTALHIAAQCGPGQRYSSTEGGPVVASLLSRGADREARTRGGVTPLHLASLRGHLGVVSALLHAGAAPGPTTQAGLTPLHLAAQEDHMEVAAALLSHGAALEPKTQLGYTPLHIASHYGNIRMVAFLLQHGVDVNAKNKDGYTALHQATQQGHGNIVNLLLQHGAEPNERCSDGSRPLDVARSLGYISLEDTLQRVTDEPMTIFKETGADKHKLNVPETMTEFPEVSDDEGKHPPHRSTTIPSLLVSTFDAEDVSGLEDDSSPLTEQLEQQSILGYVPGSTSYSTLYSSPYKSPLRISKDHPLPISESEVFYMPLVDAQEDDFLLTSPMSSGFLVSFVADARGGHARASRHPGLRLAVPPLACPAPTRLTCRLVRGSSSRPASIAEVPTLPEGEGVVSRLFDIGPAGGHFLSTLHLPPSPPTLDEGENLAAPILQLGPPGTTFLRPVVLELPHCASLQGGSRELMILRGEEGGGWKEHMNDASDEEMDSILDALGLERNPMMGRVVRVAARTLPRYIAIVSRLAQEGGFVPPVGGKLLSSMEQSVSAEIPEGAVTKPVRLGLQVMPVSPELVHSLGGNDVSFGPVVTLEPRRRKFHRPISLSLPLPFPPEGHSDTEARPPQKKDIHLLCSIAGGSMPAQWEDVTSTTPLHMDDVKKQISFSSSISARFWPVLVSGPGDPLPLASRLYSQLLHVPYLARFVLHTRAQPTPSPRRGSGQGDGTAVQCVCRTEMTGRGPGAAELLSGLGDGGLTEMARSKEVEVYAGRAVGVHCRGNLAIVSTKAPPEFTFQPFQLNRLNFALRVRDSTQLSSGRLSFVQAPGETVCNLNIMLPPTGKVGGYQKKDLEPMETIEGIMQSLDQKLTSGLRAFEESWPETTDHTKPEDGTQTDDADQVSPVTSVQEAFVIHKLSLPVPAPQDMTNISAADIETTKMKQLDITDPQRKDEDIKAEDDVELTKSQNEVAMLKFLMSPLFGKEGKLDNVATLEMKTADFPEISLKKISTEQVPEAEAEVSGRKEFRTEDSENKKFISNLFPELKTSPKVPLEETPPEEKVSTKFPTDMKPPPHAPKQFIASTDALKRSLLSDFTDFPPAEYVEKCKTYKEKPLTTSQDKSRDESTIPRAVPSTTEPVSSESYSEEIVRAEAIIQEGTPFFKEGIIRDRVRVTTQICKPGFTTQHSTITMEKVIGDESTRKISPLSDGATFEAVSKGPTDAKPADIISEARMDLTNVFESQGPSLSTLVSEQTTERFSIPQPDFSSSEDDFAQRIPTEDSSLSEVTVIELQMEGMHVAPELPIDETMETHSAEIADAKCKEEAKKSTIEEQKTEHSIKALDILQSSSSTRTSPEKTATLQDVQAAPWMSDISDVDKPPVEHSDRFAGQGDTEKEVQLAALPDQKYDKVDYWKTTEEEGVTDVNKERRGFSVHDDPQSEEIISQFTDGKTSPQSKQSLHSERYSPTEERSEEDPSKVPEDLEQYTALTSEEYDEVKMEKTYKFEAVLTRTVTSYEHRTRQVHEDASTKSTIPAEDKTKSLFMPSRHEILQEDEGASRKGTLKAWTPEIEVANIRTLKSWKSLEREEFPEKRLADEKVCSAPSEKDSKESKEQFKSNVDLKKSDIQVCDESPELEHSHEPDMITEEPQERKEEKEILETKEHEVKGKEDMDVMEELGDKKAEKKDYKDEEVNVEAGETQEEEKKGEVELQVKLKKTEKEKETVKEEQKEKEIDYKEKRKDESDNIMEGWKEKEVEKDKEPLKDTMTESHPPITEALIEGDDKATPEVSLEKEVAEELGARSTSSDEEELVTTRVIRRRVIIKGDGFEDVPGESVTEEQYTDEQGNVITRKVTRKIIRRVMPPGGTERKDVTMQGEEQQSHIDGTDSSLIQLGESRVVKRTVIKTKGRHSETTVSEMEDSGEAEPRQEISREELVGDMWGERREKKAGDPRLSEGLPTAKEDFETLLLFAGLPARLFQQDLHESQVHNADGSVTTRTRFQKSKGFERARPSNTRSSVMEMEKTRDSGRGWRLKKC